MPFVRRLSALLIAAALLFPVALAEADSVEAALSVETIDPAVDTIDPGPADETPATEDECEETVAAESAADENEVVAAEAFEAEVVPDAEDAAVTEFEADLDEAAPNRDEAADDALREISEDAFIADDGTLEEYFGEAASIADGDALFSGYVRGVLGMDDGALYAARNLGNDLTGKEKALYDILKSGIQQVAAGTRASTAFTLDNANGLDNENVRHVMLSLIADNPFELYWFANTWIWRRNGSGQMTVSLTVGRTYSAGEYQVNTATASLASAVAANARAIVDKYAGLSDYDKLAAYRDEICDAVTYNYAAINASARGTWPKDDKNPWQLLWALDGDPSTNVVCEGYAEAFQYLCDITSFSGNVYCCSIFGQADGEDHEWNIVHMPNGKNYLADITWCDTGGHGTYDWMFLKAPVSGSVSRGYSFNVRGGGTSHRMTGTYVYGPEALAIFSTADLTLSSGSYLDEMSEVPPSPDDSLPTIAVLRSTRATVNLGTVYQIDLGGSVGTGYSSSRRRVATVSASGVIIPKATGRTRISMKVGRKRRTLTLTVVDPTIPTSVTLDQSGTIAWYMQDPLTLTATLPEGTNSAIKWTTSHRRVATVNNGTLTFRRAGRTTITATAVRGRKRAWVKIRVIDGSRASAVAIEPPASTTLRVGKSIALSARATLARPADPDNPTYDPTVRWKSSRSRVASIDRYTGELTAWRAGRTTITVTTGSGKKARIRINVID